MNGYSDQPPPRDIERRIAEIKRFIAEQERLDIERITADVRQRTAEREEWRRRHWFRWRYRYWLPAWFVHGCRCPRCRP